MKSLSPYHHVLRRTDRSFRTKEQSTRNLSPEGLSGALPYPTQLTALCLFVMQKNQSAAGETGQFGNIITSGVELDKGQAIIGNLAPGTYYLHETKAPDGYNLATEDLVIIVA